MKPILVATDFSERSDRAIAQAALIAASSEAPLRLVHVVDDDQKQAMIDSEIAVSHQLLQEDAIRVRQESGVTCTTAVVTGDAFDGVLRAAEHADPALIVVGAHRRRLLRNVFVGTTAQRTIRGSRWPVLMVNAPPAQDYANIMLATDLSEASAAAVAGVAKLRLGKQTIVLMHVFDAPAQQLAMRGALTKTDMGEYLGALKDAADHDLAQFAASLPTGPYRMLTRHYDTTVSAAILDAASQGAADLIVVVSHGRVDLKKAFIGSVAEDVLRRADRDVLVIPPDMQP